MKKIIFKKRIGEDGVLKGAYQNIVDTMIDPVVKYLPEDSYDIINVKYNKYRRMWGEEYDERFFTVTFYSDICCRTGFYISHGIADKLYREANMIKDFDYIGVSGRLWVDKLVSQGMNKNKLIIIGYPKLDEIFQNKKPKEKHDKINVLFAPTHNVKAITQKSVSSYPHLLSETGDFNELFNFKICAHPVNKELNKEENLNSTMDELQWADVVISDAGSLLYEAWALDIPVVFPDWIIKENISMIFPKSFEDYIFRNDVGYHANNIDHMKELIYKAYENGIDDKTSYFIDGIFDRNLRGKSGQETANVLMDLVRY